MALHDKHDFNPTDYHHRDVRAGHYGYAFPALFGLFLQKAHAALYSISRQSLASSSVRYVNHLLLKKCQSGIRQSRPARVDLYRFCSSTASLETADAAFHRGRYSLLYAVDSICFHYVTIKEDDAYDFFRKHHPLFDVFVLKQFPF